MLPEFESREPYPYDVLPDGVHFADESMFRGRFVDDFPDSPERAAICAGFFRLRRDALEQGLIATQWVNGSFVETKLDPGDVDVVSFVDYDFLHVAVCRLPRKLLSPASSPAVNRPS